MMTPRILPRLIPLGIAALVLTGCTGTAAPTESTAAATTAPSASPTAEAVPTPASSATGVSVTCDELIIPDLHEELVTKGWSFKEAPFSVGGVTLSDGLQCTWADFSKASGALLLFGWARATKDQSAQIQNTLEQQGWTRETSGDVVYLTQDASQAPTVDENGYGITYEFGEGWITLSDTKQNLLLIQRPEN